MNLEDDVLLINTLIMYRTAVVSTPLPDDLRVRLHQVVGDVPAGQVLQRVRGADFDLRNARKRNTVTVRAITWRLR